MMHSSLSRSVTFFLLLSLVAFPLRTCANATEESQEDRQKLKVMSFNIWVDAKQGGVAQTAKVIQVAEPDVVGIQEVNESGKQLAELTGMTFHKQKRGGILTRFEIVQESKSGLGLQLRTDSGLKFWIFNVHLFHAPYQPYQLTGIPYRPEDVFIHSAAEAIAQATLARGLETAELLMDMGPAILAKEPIVVTGDFNEPSHLDWGADAVEAQKVPLAVQWPQSRMMMDAGFQDAYRTVHPDAVNRRGDTWTPKPSARDRMDRIDFVYSLRFTPEEALVVGESSDRSDIVVDPYPSDHRAVVVEFSFSPAAAGASTRSEE